MPAAPAGTNETAARLLAVLQGPALSRTVVVENRLGASGNVAMQQAARPAGGPHAADVLLRLARHQSLRVRKLWLGPSEGFCPGRAGGAGAACHLALSGLAASLRQLIDEGRAPGLSLIYGSLGACTLQHIGGVMLAERMGLQLIHVPYGGAAPALNDVVSGAIDLLITNVPPSAAQIAGGRVDALALTAAERHPMLPGLPTAAEAGLPDYAVESWFAAFTAAGPPPQSVARWDEALRAIVASGSTLASRAGGAEGGDSIRIAQAGRLASSRTS